MSTNLETMVGRAPDVQVLRHVAYPIEIDTPHTREEAAVLRSIAPHMVAVNTQDIDLSRPGYHAVGIIGDTPDHLGHYIFCTTHSVGPGTLIYHPWSNTVVDLGEENVVDFPPDTTCVEWTPQYGQIDRGMQLRPYLPGEACWIGSLRYGGNGTFRLRCIAQSIISGAYASDFHGTVCPVIDGGIEAVGPGRSGSAVIQRLPKEEYGEGYGLVGLVHGLSTTEKVMFSPTLPEL